jgi:predicted O-linked N-acetylglucosamine transferase (SPINDLY family)
MATLSEALAIAVAHHQAGRLETAQDLYRRILAVEPNHARALQLLGMAAYQLGQHAVAVEHIQHAIQLQPEAATYHNNLGEVYRALGKFQEAVACYQRAIELRPDLAELHNNLGNAWKSFGKLDDAVACYRRALELKPDFAEAHNNLGNAWKALGRPAEAESCYRRALHLRPDLAGACTNLANVLQTQGKLEASVDSSRRALELHPDSAEAYGNLANALQGQGKLDESIACYREALRLAPDRAEFHSNYLCGLRYLPQATLADLSRASAEFERRCAAPFRATWPAHRDARRAGPLRLGFVSPSFACRPTGYFLIRALEHLDRRRCEVFCYSDRPSPDRMTFRFQKAASQWRDVFGLTDEQLAEQVRADEIDILFDLVGHAPGNRLFMFARRPAPIQITWIDSVGTTGMSAIDYVIADPYEIPPESEPYYAERVLRMPRTYVTYDPADDARPVGPTPAAGSGHVTFGSFNNPAKIAPEVVALWARILHRVDGSRLLLKYHGFDDPGSRRQYGERFARCGISDDRVEFQGGAPHAELLACYKQVDVALDPIYNGGLTTCEALWMGVPVVTCPGETFPRRHSLSHLSNVGLTETIAGDFDQYVDLAVRLAGDLPRLAELRAGLRDRMAASPLCDGGQFAADLLAMLEGLRP